MSFYQKSVIDKYIKNLNKETLNISYFKFKTHFHNSKIQENIRNSKEEQYQGEFLIDLFVNILGYTKNPNTDFNITTEYKNVKDSKKADGAIIFNGKVKAVIELKGTETTDLVKIENQAFGYKNNQINCTYVVTSNFEKLRLYVDNTIDFIDFNLFTITEKEFEILYLLLACQNLENDIPKKIKDESICREDLITKKLYYDYSTFKKALHSNLVALNPEFDALTLFKKSQKLLDRFLFLFFAEDRQLLPPNSVRLILSDWNDLLDRDVKIPLYERFKNYFEYLRTGFKGKRFEVFAYNGGLFNPDEILDSIIIDDNLLLEHTKKLSEYDFESEVDVNILGHIFENSLNEIDEIKAQTTGSQIDKTSNKRKKDGIFYTPKYITKYIVDNTVGKLCNEKKIEFGIIEHDYTYDKKRQKKTTQVLLNKLTDYKNWLLKITICDPACGSGAFLNQALDFLIAEHRYIDELYAKLFGVPMVLSDIEKSILENNLFGVDINEESVEIAKLSLWLRTAQPNRKLNDLTNNIKCGNSLIDDPEIAGEKAFNWHKEFPQIFGKSEIETFQPTTPEPEPDYIKLIKEHSEKAQELSKSVLMHTEKVLEYAEKITGVSELSEEYNSKNFGFDVVIGNPPYVMVKHNPFYQENYITANCSDLYAIFYEKSIHLLKNNGIAGLITPSSYLTNIGFSSLREFLIQYKINTIIDLGENVFSDASVDSAILTVEKFRIENHFINCSGNNFKFTPIEKRIFSTLDNKIFNIYINPAALEIAENIEKRTKKINDFINFSRGIEIGFSSEFVFSSKIEPDFKPILCGGNIARYQINFDHKFVKHNTKDISIYKNKEIYENEKILVRRIGNSIISCFDNAGFYNVCDVYNLQLKSNDNYNLKVINAILNSRFIYFYYDTKFKSVKKLFPKIPIQNLKLLPIPDYTKISQESLLEKVNLILQLNKELQESAQKFVRTIQRKFEILDLPSKLQAWYLLKYPEFIKELGKKKVKLSLSAEAEWEAYFLQESKIALAIKHDIEATDREIDQLVYALYELTKEEIAIVMHN